MGSDSSLLKQLFIYLFIYLFGVSQVPRFPVVKNWSANAEDTRDAGSIPELGRSIGEGNGNPLQCSCLENPMDRGAWWAAVHGVAKSRVQLSTHTFIYVFIFMMQTDLFACITVRSRL